MVELNATSNVFTISMSSVSLTIIFLMIIGTIILLLANEIIAYYLICFGKFLKKTLGNFFIGLLTLLIGVPIYWLYSINARQLSQGNPIMLKWTGIVISIYLLVSFIGWIAKHCWLKIFSAFKKARRKMLLLDKMNGQIHKTK